MQGTSITPRRKLTVTMAALTLAVPFAGVAFANEDKGKGGERRQTAPGQEKKAENAPQPGGSATGGNGYGAGKREKPAKPAKPGKPGKPAKSAKPGKPENTHARAGRTTICHATGSDTNPFVAITISNNALKAHARHQDGEDIIPAPAAGCPKGERKAAPKAKDPAKAGHGQAKVTICHATGSQKNPYVKITIAEPAVEAHKRHQDGRDIIPAPEGDCPAAAVVPDATRKALGAPAALLTAPAAMPAAAAGGSLPRGGVLGESAEGGAAPASAVAANTVRRESGAEVSGSLPFTGLDTWLLVVLGLGALLAGVALRRSAASHR